MVIHTVTYALAAFPSVSKFCSVRRACILPNFSSRPMRQRWRLLMAMPMQRQCLAPSQNCGGQMLRALLQALLHR